MRVIEKTSRRIAMRLRSIRFMLATVAVASAGVGVAMFAQADAVIYYVSPSGLDSNAGTSVATPFRTIQHALDLAVPGTEIRLAPGIYKESLVTRTAGTAGDPIVIQGPETGKDVSGRYQAVLYGSTNRVLSVDHSYYSFAGFTIDGQEQVNISEYPTSFAETRSFKDSVQARVTDSKLIYIGAADTSADVNNVIVKDMFLNGAGGECIRMRNRAAHNLVLDSVIQWCGMFGKGNDRDQYKYHNAEGVYIGTSPKSTTQPMYANDTSNNNVIRRSTIRTFGSECFNVKENGHSNVMEDSECLYNDEPLDFNGSNIELRGDHNVVRNTVISGSRSWNLKMWSDEARYDLGGNSVQAGAFSGAAGPAISNRQAEPGLFCGSTFPAGSDVQVAGEVSVGDPTVACPPTGSDTMAPAVSITAPADNAELAGTVTIKADASDDKEVAKVEFYAGDTLIGTDVIAPYSVSWDIPSALGPYDVSAKAYDPSGNTGSDQITIISSTDTAAPTQPLNLSGQATGQTATTLDWSAASDNIGVTGYDVYRDGSKVATVSGTTFQDSGLTANTTYVYAVRAFDAAGNVSPASPDTSITTWPVAATVEFEAESGIVTSPMLIQSDTEAQGGQYIVQTSGKGSGKAVYTFTVPQTGTYTLSGRAIAPTTSSNAFNYNFDTASQQIWDLPVSTAWAWGSGPSVHLTAGTHTLTVAKREPNAKLDAIRLTMAIPVAVLEAESGTLTGGMALAQDGSASGGAYVIGQTAGRATYTFYVPEAGTYMIAGWIKAANSSSDSFNVSVDGSAPLAWDLLDPTSSWTYDATTNPSFTLSAGAHTVTIDQREAGASLDRLTLIRPGSVTTATDDGGGGNGGGNGRK